jgi:hypothetical protein
MERKPAVLVRARDAAARRRTLTQRLNPGSRFSGAPLSRISGLTRAIVNLISDYPKLGKRFLLVPEGGRTAFHELGAAQFPFGPADEGS